MAPSEVPPAIASHGRSRGMAHRIVVMGVSGSGKSSVAAALAERLGLACHDGDDFHAGASVQKMRRGIALTDDDRWPWLDHLGRLLAAAEGGAVVSCSALRRAYRDRLRAACAGLRFVFLHGDAALIEQRMRARQGHYMPASLLGSQLALLEPPGADEGDVITLDVDRPLATLVQQAIEALDPSLPQEARSR
jgi:carbohydrate kinase (thermoresistant glucokinase family)